MTQFMQRRSRIFYLWNEKVIQECSDKRKIATGSNACNFFVYQPVMLRHCRLAFGCLACFKPREDDVPLHKNGGVVRMFSTVT